MKVTHTEHYARLRALAYPSPAEFADAVYWQARGDPKPMQAYLKRCDEVKARYPKPSEPQ